MVVDQTRKMIKTEVDSISLDMESLVRARSIIDNAIKMYGENATIEVCSRMYSDSEYLAILQYVPETDQQMTTRIELEQQMYAQAEVAQRALYQSLKAKFD